MNFDHVALVSKNISASVEWYNTNLGAAVLYQDETWGLVQVANVKIAFVVSHQHPPHICFEVSEKYAEANLAGKVFKKHRDGTESCYIKDCDGNFIEFLKCPKEI